MFYFFDLGYEGRIYSVPSDEDAKAAMASLREAGGVPAYLGSEIKDDRIFSSWEVKEAPQWWIEEGRELLNG